ncbi:hypothetical protein CDAR_76031 [Caerostris darwini]|uniref:Uncharacterized protein n=1 Tax=Caerostris darwini TaxID=1538125 RepID=A0AAV4Q9I9_9ARAC|nr:hypothetical protein CDAR_76031 [Caerostris darwini]
MEPRERERERKVGNYQEKNLYASKVRKRSQFSTWRTISRNIKRVAFQCAFRVPCSPEWHLEKLALHIFKSPECFCRLVHCGSKVSSVMQCNIFGYQLLYAHRTSRGSLKLL